jgi:indoleamine 2,3-dioxygenase
MFVLIKGIIRNKSQNLYRIQSVLSRKNSTLIGAFSSSQPKFQVQYDNFNILKDSKEHDTTLPSFMVGYKNGFLPRQVDIHIYIP